MRVHFIPPLFVSLLQFVLDVYFQSVEQSTESEGLTIRWLELQPLFYYPLYDVLVISRYNFEK